MWGVGGGGGGGVVLTVCLDDVSVHTTKRPAHLILGRRHVPVDMTSLALHLCAGP